MSRKKVSKIGKFEFGVNEKTYIFAPHLRGAIAQLVEQRTENPCVRGSIPRGTTSSETRPLKAGFFI